MTITKMQKSATPQRFVQLFANYDKSFVDKLRTVKYRTTGADGVYIEKPIMCVFATPERAFAQIAKQIARRKNLDKPSRAQLDEIIKTIPLPIASVSRLVGSVDQSRFVNYQFKRLAITNEFENTRYYGTRRPLPWTFKFQVDTWARNIQVRDDLHVQMMLWLRSTEFWMTVSHPAPINNVRVVVDFEGMVDNSQLESETEQRLLRESFTFKVSGWLCYAPQTYGIVETIINNFYYVDEDGNETFEDQLIVVAEEET